MAYRSLLFVPGARPDRFAKAAASGADAVCIDLEDAVAPGEKDRARAATLEYLLSPAQGAAIGIRINSLTTVDGLHDAAALAAVVARPAFVMIPKIASAEEIHQVREILGSHCPPLWPLMETPAALFALPSIAHAVGMSGGIMFGGVDYSACLGSNLSWDALLLARGSIVAAAALVGCEAMDVPFLDIKDDDGLSIETHRVRGMGFTGRAAIHPAQIATINLAFSPSKDEVSKARRIAEAYEAASGGAALLDGKLIEKPVLRAAQRVLAADRTEGK